MILDKFKLDGKVAIITGCRRGLGRGITLGLAETGADIVGVSYSECSVIKSAVEKLGRQFLEIKADLREQDVITGIIEKAVQKFGKIDILVNNAGIIRRENCINLTETDWDDVMNINIKTLFFLSQAAACQFIRQKSGGKIINIASLLSFQGGINVPSYTASKSAVMGVTRIMSNEWAKYKINVNAIAPGYMATDMTAPLCSNLVRNKEILERIPAGRWGKPEDLQGVVVFLASDASSYLHGYTIAVDGGWLAR